MKYSYSWLKELSKTELSSQKMAENVSMHAFEFEEMQEFSGGFENVVIGQIESIKKHPNADRLQLAIVNVGNKKLDVVCGAPNIKKGDKVPVALPGAVLGGNFLIKETEIRGAKSQGMLCSKKELGLGNDHAGIFILNKSAKIGEKFSDYMKLGDSQLEFAILPNRSHDVLSHAGMAREICAIEGRKFNNGSLASIMEAKLPGRMLKIEIKNKDLCSRYIGVTIEGIQIMPSPQWMQSRLTTCGLKPINNIVDITNYVMLETGQPLHAFDILKLETLPIGRRARNSKPEIIVRRARKGEKIKLLDEKEYELGENNLVIADSKNAIALAGVMGGHDSAITKDTNSIVLESANFNATNIRKTRTDHGLITESSYRFERNIDPNLAETGAARAVELIKKYGGKNVQVSAMQDAYPKKIISWKIKLDSNYANKLLGESVAMARMKNILMNLGIEVKSSGKFLDCEIPTRRIDLKTQEDLIEEIGRIYGYENIKEQAPIVKLESPRVNEKRRFEDKLRDVMIGLGFSEVMNYSFYGKDDIEKCNLDINKHFEVENPMNPEQRYLRTNLAPGLLKNVKTNLKYFDEFSIFEIGREYLDEDGKEPEERLVLAGMLVDNSREQKLFFSLKGKLEAVLGSAGPRNAKYKALSTGFKFWHHSRTAEIFCGDIKLGKIGEINPQTLKKYGIKQRVVMFGLNVDKLLSVSAACKEHKPISKYPSVKRDISMFVPKGAQYKDIAESITSSGGKLVLGVELFDIFEKDGQKSMALRIEIGSNEKTLTSEEIEAVMEKIIEKLERGLKVSVRK